MNQFILGVIASLVATCLLFLSKNIWLEYWHLLFSKVYPQISGRYKITGLYDRNYQAMYPDMVEILDIKQFGKKLKGKAIVLSGEVEKQHFFLSGFVTAHNTIIINYENTTPQNTETGSYVITMEGIDKKLTGHVSYICGNCSKVHDYPVEMVKVG